MGAVKPLIIGKHRGIVKSAADKQSLGRLQVHVPTVNEGILVWAMPSFPYAGKELGMAFIPPKDSWVWVEFERGDMSYPIWSGCFWPDQNSGSIIAKPQTHTSHIIQTEKMTLKIDEAKGVSLTVDDMNVELSNKTITIKNGSSTITITEDSIDAKASQKASIQGQNLELKGSGETIIDAGKLKLKGDPIKLSGGDITAKGGNILLEGSKVDAKGTFSANGDNFKVSK